MSGLANRPSCAAIVPLALSSGACFLFKGRLQLPDPSMPPLFLTLPRRSGEHVAVRAMSEAERTGYLDRVTYSFE